MKCFLSILSALVLLTGGCTISDDLSAGEDTRVPLELNIYVEGNVRTRSATPLMSGSIGIYLLPENDYSQGAYLYSAISGNWTAGTPLMLSGNEASVCVWYPYNYRIPADLAGLKAFPLTAQPFTGAADLCYQVSTGGLNNRNYSLQARLQHAYSLLEFHLSRDITFKTAGNVGSITLSATGLLHSITLDITTGSYANPAGGNVTYNAGVTVPATGEVITALLLPPATLTGDLSLTFRVDGKDMTAVLPRTSLPGFVAGTKYIVRGTLQRELDITLTTDLPDGTAGGEIVW